MRVVAWSGLMLVLAALLSGFEGDAKAIGDKTMLTAAEAHGWVGERVKVCDRVASRWRDTIPQGTVRVQLRQPGLVILGESQGVLHGLDRLREGSKVCVTGLVEMESNSLRIVVTDTSQLSMEQPGFEPMPLLSKQGSDDAEIRRILVAQSRASYPGSCPCPDTLDGKGNRCGRRSAYSQSGGTALLCSVDDVTDAMIREYRRDR